jgi:hypothetical protein
MNRSKQGNMAKQALAVRFRPSPVSSHRSAATRESSNIYVIWRAPSNEHREASKDATKTIPIVFAGVLDPRAKQEPVPPVCLGVKSDSELKRSCGYLSVRTLFPSLDNKPWYPSTWQDSEEDLSRKRAGYALLLNWATLQDDQNSHRMVTAFCNGY